MVDLYYALYGTRRPLCLQSAEMNSMYKDFIREGTSKKTSSAAISSIPKVLPEVKTEVRRDEPDILESKSNVMTAIKRTASEAFEDADVGSIKMETHEEIAVVNEIIKDEIYEDGVKKMEVSHVESETYVSETKKLKSEAFDEDDNSVTIIDISETTITRMDSSFDSSRADGDLRQKMDASSKVCRC